MSVQPPYLFGEINQNSLEDLNFNLKMTKVQYSSRWKRFEATGIDIQCHTMLGTDRRGNVVRKGQRLAVM